MRELAILQMSALIRAKPERYFKMNDPIVDAGWTQEAADQGMAEAQIRYGLEELAYVAVG
jgi:hypothetical protein